MKPSKLELVKLAGDIRDQLLLLKKSREKEVQQRLAKLASAMASLQDISRKLSICETRAWNAASARVMKEIERPFYELNFLVREVEQVVTNAQIPAPALQEIYLELLQVDADFDALSYDPKERCLSVSTEPIELEGIYLGPFEIQLHIPSLSEMQYGAYSIVALDPHPAGSNEAVTHPHVSDEGLCAGDGGAAIRMALANGRICDFFLLVQAVLTNYNPRSPYVSLENWDGVPCYDCGYTMDGDGAHWCEACQNDFCSECISYCVKCEGWFCRECLMDCEICGDHYCRDCMTTCPDCGRELCMNCLEGSQCTCLEEENEDDDGEESEEGAAARAGEPEEGSPASQVA